MKTSSVNILRYAATVLKIFLFWLIIFQINRLAFVIYFHDRFSSFAFSQTALSFIHGIRLDIATACYLFFFAFVVLIIQQFFSFRFLKAFLFSYIIIVLLLASFVSVFDIGIYHDWNTHANYRAMNYLRFVKEASAFSDSHENFVLALLMLSQVLIGITLLILFFRRAVFRFNWRKQNVIPVGLIHLAIFPLLFIGVRGGLQLIPINESSAYFSSEKILNDAALNVQWNAAKKYFSNSYALTENPYHYFSDSEASSIVKSLYAEKDSSISVLNTSRPNIVLFVLESFTADVIEQLGGEEGVTPNLDTVIKHGLLFSNIYSQGYRTDQGLAAIFSGFPAVPNFSVEMQPEKYNGLAFLPKQLSESGYSNSFYYGGEVDFANMKAYLLESGISDVHDKSSYTKDEMNAKWGAHDEYVFRKQASELRSRHQPFFSVILSLSSHEPFQVPMPPQFPGEDDPSKFKSSCFYTDKCIGEYLKTVSSEPLFKNTLFIFVADHGHTYPRNRQWGEAARFHIPIIFYGEVLKAEFRGKKIENTGMQCDLTSTLLSQLQLAHDQFHWSNDLLNPFRKNFAYYSYDSGFGWVNDHGWLRYDFATMKADTGGGTGEIDLTQSKAFLQSLYSEYISF